MNRSRSIYDEALETLLGVSRKNPLDPAIGERRLLSERMPFKAKDPKVQARDSANAEVAWGIHLAVQTAAHDGENPTVPPPGLVCSARLGEVAKLY